MTVAERLLERELLGVFEGGATELIDGVGEDSSVGVAEGDNVREGDVEQEFEAMLATKIVEKVGVGLGVLVGVIMGGVPLAKITTTTGREAVGEAVLVRDAVGEAVRVRERESVRGVNTEALGDAVPSTFPPSHAGGDMEVKPEG